MRIAKLDAKGNVVKILDNPTIRVAVTDGAIVVEAKLCSLCPPYEKIEVDTSSWRPFGSDEST